MTWAHCWNMLAVRIYSSNTASPEILLFDWFCSSKCKKFDRKKKVPPKSLRDTWGQILFPSCCTIRSVRNGCPSARACRGLMNRVSYQSSPRSAKCRPHCLMHAGGSRAGKQHPASDKWQRWLTLMLSLGHSLLRRLTAARWTFDKYALSLWSLAAISGPDRMWQHTRYKTKT